MTDWEAEKEREEAEKSKGTTTRWFTAVNQRLEEALSKTRAAQNRNEGARSPQEYGAAVVAFAELEKARADMRGFLRGCTRSQFRVLMDEVGEALVVEAGRVSGIELYIMGDILLAQAKLV